MITATQSGACPVWSSFGADALGCDWAGVTCGWAGAGVVVGVVGAGAGAAVDVVGAGARAAVDVVGGVGLGVVGVGPEPEPAAGKASATTTAMTWIGRTRTRPTVAALRGRIAADGCSRSNSSG
jgi:hypothetical protein